MINFDKNLFHTSTYVASDGHRRVLSPVTGDTRYVIKSYGTAANPIVFKAESQPGVTFTSGLLLYANYTWIWGFEVTNVTGKNAIYTICIKATIFLLNKFCIGLY